MYAKNKKLKKIRKKKQRYLKVNRLTLPKGCAII